MTILQRIVRWIGGRSPADGPVTEPPGPRTDRVTQKRETTSETEKTVDKAAEGTFPASDPPPWTPGTAPPDGSGDAEDPDKEKPDR